MPRILIADDSDLVRTFLRTALIQFGSWSVCGEAVNGRQAVLMAADLSPDLVLLDFAMPMLNGLEAAEEILKTAPCVPIALYTLHHSSQLQSKANKTGPIKVIAKSDGLLALVTSLRELLGETGDSPESSEGILPPRSSKKPDSSQN
jgi:DNA-binding NarL/FixJ family response regulator